MSHRLPLVVATAFLATLAATARSQPATRVAARASVLLVTLDTTRADRLGCYGDPSMATPWIDRLTRSGALFEEAISDVPLTLPAHASMMTGAQPYRTGVRDNGHERLVEGLPTVASLLRERGYHTSAFVASVVLDRVFGLDRGFDVYDDDVRVGRPEAFGYQERAASQVARALADHSFPPDRPVFAWIHFYDPHEPYVAPRPFEARAGSDPYEAELAFVDWGLAAVVRELRAKGLWDDLTVVMGGDHGESLGAHGERAHGVFLYEDTVRVPLVMRVPGSAPRLVRGLARSVDLGPTILALAGAPAGLGPDGVDLSAALSSGTTGVEEAYLESVMGHRGYGWSALFGIRSARWLYVRAPREEVYDLRADPACARDVADTRPDWLAAGRKALARHPYLEAPSRPAQASDEITSQLESLGYAGASTRTDAKEKLESGADPKDGIAILKRGDEANTLMAQGRLEDAATILRTMAKEQPRNVLVRSQLATCLLRGGKPEEALSQWDSALAVVRVDYLLVGRANALALMGKTDLAIAAYREALAKNARNVDAYGGWVDLLLAKGDVAAARTTLDEALAQGLRDPGLFRMRGRLAAADGDFAMAQRLFESSLAQNPEQPDSLADLGALLYQSGHVDQALGAYERAILLAPGSVDLLRTAGSIFLLSKNDVARARELFLRALALMPPGPERDELAEMVKGLPRS